VGKAPLITIAKHKTDNKIRMIEDLRLSICRETMP
jgi:hypothetical protein